MDMDEHIETRPAAWLVRHGQRPWNALGWRQGQSDDARLTRRGYRQAPRRGYLGVAWCNGWSEFWDKEETGISMDEVSGERGRGLRTTTGRLLTTLDTGGNGPMNDTTNKAILAG